MSAEREQFFAQLREWREAGWQRPHLLQQRGRDRAPARSLAAGRSRCAALHHRHARAAASSSPRRKSPCSATPSCSAATATRARAGSPCAGRARSPRRAQIDFSELIEGDFVVHLEHGIGRYEGMKLHPARGGPDRGCARPRVRRRRAPLRPARAELSSSRATSASAKGTRALSELGDGKWAKRQEERGEGGLRLRRETARRSTPSARRSRASPSRPTTNGSANSRRPSSTRKRPTSSPPSSPTKADMETEQPMDRLICGDVGFGKTEVAIRAAFKAVMGGKQVAMLVPTTVLAEQHYRNFRERMSDYPITVEMLSPLPHAGASRTQDARRPCAKARVDIVIGTHRLISKDVAVQESRPRRHRRRAALRRAAQGEVQGDVPASWTCSRFRATPIPRTLYLSLMGAKDMSTIETAAAQSHPGRNAHLPATTSASSATPSSASSRARGRSTSCTTASQTSRSVRDRIQQLVPEGARSSSATGRWTSTSSRK